MSAMTLKLIAIITMIIDHIGFALFDNNVIMRGIGRISFPIFCFLLVEGYLRTKKIKKYFSRLLIFAFISELPFDLMRFYSQDTIGEFSIKTAIQHQNVLFTLALGLLAIWGFTHYVYKGKIAWGTGAVLACGIVSILIKSDYDIIGIIIIVAMFLYRTNLQKMFTFIGVLLLILAVLEGRYEGMAALLAFIPIALYNNKKGYSSKILQMGFYLVYPLQGLIIFLLK